MMKLNLLRCFTTVEANSGNLAAVVRDFNGDNTAKQALAITLNLPVTVFLSELSDKRHAIEFFYPKMEAPLCIHGAIGAAYIIFQQEGWNKLTFVTKTKRQLIVKLSGQVIQIKLSSQSVPWVKIDKPLICEMLNLNSQDSISLALPLLVSSAGSPKLLIPLTSPEKLSEIKPNFSLITQWSDDQNVNGLYCL